MVASAARSAATSWTEVRRLAADGRFDYLLVESTGISGPLPVAATFDFRTPPASAFPTSPGSTRC